MATSMLTTGDPEEVISCPYNKAHQIIRKRMQFHLVKCKKNYPNVELQECIFNSVHKVPKHEMQAHLEQCPYRAKVDRFVFRHSDNAENNTLFNQFPVKEIEINSTEECWDNVNVPAYDPVKKCESTPVLRQLNVESAAKRRNFRNAERQRLQALEEIQPQITRTERQHAADIAPRLRAGSSTNRITDVDEEDPFEVASLMERIRMGAVPIVPMNDRSASRVDDTDTDNIVSDGEKWQTQTKAKKGYGRGKFIKKTSS